MRASWLPVIAVLACSAAGFAQETSALINKALDEPVKLNIDNTLPQALDAITKQTGVRFHEDPAVWDLLPWGRETRIQAKIENATLREALKMMMRKLGLVLVLRDEFVEVQPMAGLRRLGQRASLDELAALDLLATRPLGLETDRPTIKRLLEAIDLKLAAEKDVQVAVENRIGDLVSQDKTVFVPRNATLMEALESLTKSTRATWYPWEKSIVVCTKEDRTRKLLNKPLSMRPPNRGSDVMDFLLEISTRTGIPFEFQPGVVQTVPAESRIFRGTLTNVPAAQIMEYVAGATGLSYSVLDDRILIASPQSATGAQSRDRAIGMLQLPSGMQVLVPQSQVPPDMQEYLRHKMQKELEKIRQLMEEEGFKPTTRPTHPERDETL